jgi:hypothetical protein
MTAEQGSERMIALGERLVAANQDLVMAVVEALKGFGGTSSPAAAEQARPWEERVLPLLRRDLAKLVEALAGLRRGDPGPIVHLAEYQMGLGKQLDLGFEWMPDATRKRVDELILGVTRAARAVVEVAGA